MSEKSDISMSSEEDNMMSRIIRFATKSGKKEDKKEDTID